MGSVSPPVLMPQLSLIGKLRTPEGRGLHPGPGPPLKAMVLQNNNQIPQPTKTRPLPRRAPGPGPTPQGDGEAGAAKEPAMHIWGQTRNIWRAQLVPMQGLQEGVRVGGSLRGGGVSGTKTQTPQTTLPSCFSSSNTDCALPNCQSRRWALLL